MSEVKESQSRSDGEPTSIAFKLEVMATNIELGLPMGALEQGFLRDAAKQLRAPVSERGRILEWLRTNAPDCGDNSCLFGGRGKGGMRTNGGCRCYKDVRPDMRRIYIERMQAALFERHIPSK